MATVADFFSGAGGLSEGFEQAGFKVVYALDMSNDAVATYNANHRSKAYVADIRSITASDVLKISRLKDIDVVIGGPPCQGFSLAGNIGRLGKKDDRNRLFLEFVRMVSELNPKFFVMENVASLSRHRRGRTVQEIKRAFEGIGYKTDCNILNAANYGVPQYRSRIFFIGNRIGQDNPFPPGTHDGVSRRFNTVSDAISDLPKLKNGGSLKRIHNHEAMTHTKTMLAKMKYVKDGGDRTDIPIRIRPRKGDARKYIRYRSDAPSVCITGDMRKVFHYAQNRALTVRELARIQTFRDDYCFLGSRISQQLQVGNAVPPMLAKAVAKGVLDRIIVGNGGAHGYNVAVQRISNNKLHRE